MTARRAQALKALAPTALTPTALALAAALASLGAGPASAAPSDLFYERTLMSVAGARCKLFDPSVAAALVAAGRQAKGAALRAGADPDALDATEGRARSRGRSVACNNKDLAVAAQRVRKGFEGYAVIRTMTFPGDSAVWRADRGGEKRFSSDWRLTQSARGRSGEAILGLASVPGGEALTAVAAWPGALAASGARLVMRDPTKARRAYLDQRRTDLAGRTPPRTVTRSFLASERAPAGQALLPDSAASGVVFRFPPVAAFALEDLDPREAVVLELVYPARGGERVEAVAFEVGDFAAGRAFLSAKRF